LKTRTIPYQDTFVRAVMDTDLPIRVAASRMTIEEARAHIAAVERAIWAYCLEVERRHLKYVG
jgi:hypothetical protein